MPSDQGRRRRETLRRYQILGTGPAEEFDRVTDLAAALFDAPIAFVNLVGAEHQWFKSAHGTDLEGSPIEHSICRYTIATPGPMVVEDLADDERFAANPFVEGGPRVRFYAGAPMETTDGCRIGTVCVLDTEPRPSFADEAPLRQLQHLADVAVEAVERQQYALGGQPELSQTVLDHLPGIFYVLGADGRLQRWNRRFEQISEYSAAELEDRPGTSFFEGEDRDRIAGAIEQVFAQGSVTVEADLVTKSGEAVPMVFTGVRARLNGQTTLVGMGVDISEQKRREAQLREAKHEAEEAARLKAAMLANMSHEVRTPLTSVIGFAEVLVSELDGQSEAFAEKILQSSQRLMQTLDSVLQLSKLDAGEYDTAPELLDLAAVTEEEVSALRSQVGRSGDSLDLKCDLPAGGLRGRWDETSLRRILRNLLHNAVKFTSGEGRVTARVLADGDAAVVEIEDTGVGMSDAFRQEAFQAFRQESRGTNRAFEGTGLGLAITQRLVDRLGGSIRIDSEKGEGTRVTVRLAREK